MTKQLFVAAIVLSASAVAPMRADPSTGSASPRASSRGEIIEQVLVKVNGEIITKTELEQRQVAVLRQKMQGQVDPETMKNDVTISSNMSSATSARSRICRTRSSSGPPWRRKT